MATVRFPSLDEADLVEVELVGPDRRNLACRMLVDSGFTGGVCFVLPIEMLDWGHGEVSDALTSGALTGPQPHMAVVWRVPALAVRRFGTAIFADLDSLTLPPDTVGIAGLGFLRQFTRWGGERTSQGQWEFFLSDGQD